MAWLYFGSLALATLAMEYALVTHDFSVSYVANVGSRATPLHITIVSLWSSLEGSLLLWTLVLAGYIAAVLVKFRSRHTDPLLGWALVVLMVVSAFFFGLMVGPANPFVTVEVEPGFRVIHVPAGAYDLTKEQLPGIVDEFTDWVMAWLRENPVDVLHANYWLSGVVGQRQLPALDVQGIGGHHQLEPVASVAQNLSPEDVVVVVVQHVVDVDLYSDVIGDGIGDTGVPGRPVTHALHAPCIGPVRVVEHGA